MKCAKMHGDGNNMNPPQNNTPEHLQSNGCIFFVIPAFNESGTIGSVVKPLIKEGYSVVVIDDCSTDETSVEALKNGATVLRHPINLGQGAALQTGIDYCLVKNFDAIVTFDADGQHQLKDAKRLIDCILNNEADIACGSRFLGTKPIGMPPARSVILRLVALYTRFSLGIPVTDAHNGLRALSRKAASTIQLTQNRMAHASELMAQIKNLRFKELPVEIVYTPYSLAKGQKLSNSLNIFLDLLIGKITK